MAGAETSDSMGAKTASQQVNALQEVPDIQCRVIKDVGDFAYIVTAKLDDVDLALTFQIEAEYPAPPVHTIIKSKTMSEFDRDSLLNYLKDQQDLPLVDIVAATRTWLQQENITFSSSPPTLEKKNMGKLKRNKNKTNQEEIIDEKASSMKTADDVIKRVLWDEQLPTESFVIGYQDRFVGLVEKPFSVFTWEDLASVDYDVFAIPKHRIQYFKYKSRIVWDKATRKDLVFGSTGSSQKILDVMQEVDQDEQEAKLNHTHTECSKLDDSESDDDIEIDTGCSVTHKDPILSPTQDSTLFPREKYWGARIRPTHFLALRITNPDIKAKVQEVQDCIVDMDPEYIPCLIPTERLHMTLACLGLDTEEDVERAAKCLNKLKTDIQLDNEEKVNIKFQNIKHFSNNTLYASVEPTETISTFVSHLQIAFSEAGISLRDVFDFVPHMTILKLSMQFGRKMNTRYLDPRLLQKFDNIEFGSQVLDNIHLCAMSEDKQADGFYICPTSISID